jgi:sucrose phosphorylase
VARTGHARSINRKKFTFHELERELAEPESLRSQLLKRFRQLLQCRKSLDAFDPGSPQEILDTPSGIFGLKRTGTNETVYCLQSVSTQPQQLPQHLLPDTPLTDAVTGEMLTREQAAVLEPLQTRWLIADR